MHCNIVIAWRGCSFVACSLLATAVNIWLYAALYFEGQLLCSAELQKVAVCFRFIVLANAVLLKQHAALRGEGQLCSIASVQ